MLEPTLFRNLENSNPRVLAKRHLEKFKIFVRGRVENTDNWDDQRYWSVGRHYGLKTPLLDWSASAFIGLFFAFHEKCKKSEICSLYALDASYINQKFCQLIGENFAKREGFMERFENRYNLEDFSHDQKKIMMGKVVLDKFDSDIKAQTEDQDIHKDIISKSVGDFFRLVSPRSLSDLG